MSNETLSNKKNAENNMLSRVIDKVEYNTYTGDHPADKDVLSTVIDKVEYNTYNGDHPADKDLLSRVIDKVEYNTYTGDHPAGKDLPLFYSPLKIHGNAKSTKRIHVKMWIKGASSVHPFPRHSRRQAGRGQP